MKKLILLSGLTLAAFSTIAQTTITDTVSMGANYANNVWYSLENDEQGSVPANNWDIALVASGSPSNPLTTSIFLNPAGSKTLTLYAVPGSTKADFATIDTAGLSTWTPLYNSDTTWALGAFNQASAGGFDYGWGSYDMTDHNIKGNKIFILKYSTGGSMGAPEVISSIRKIYIDLNTAGKKYTIVHDKLDNSDSTTTVIDFASYEDKNFIYFSFENDQVIDREPEAKKWDFLFTKYVSSTQPYGSGNALNQTVTGVLHNHGVEVAQANNVNQEDYEDYDTHTFSSHINVIGFDWKDIDYATFDWVIEDSVVYFVKDVNKDIWKVVFTGFDGSASGSYIFNKTLLYDYVEPTDNVNDIHGDIASLALYPNPAVGNNVTLIYSFNTLVSEAQVILSDLSGRIIMSKPVPATNGLQQYSIPTSGLNAGIYIVNLVTDKGSIQQKLIVQ